MGLSEIAWLFPFVVAGYFTAKYSEVIDALKFALPVAVVVWVLSAAVVWPVSMPGDRWWYAPVSAALTSAGIPAVHAISRALWAGSRVLCALAGIAALYYAHGYLTARMAAGPTWLGRRSLGIYASHGWFLIPFGLAAGGVRVLVMFATALLGGTLVTLLLERFRWTRLLLLGQST